VEFALVLPILFLILISIFELGLAFKDFLTVSYMAREGARLSAFLGTDPDADCTMITTLASNISTADLNRLQRIEIFRADTAGNQVAADTNTFTYTGTDPLDCTDWTQVITWPSTDRQTEVDTDGTPPLDVIGVRVVITHTWISQFPPYFGSFSINENTIVRMEPEAFA
jgi:Flp pilus assembly protein TadG